MMMRGRDLILLMLAGCADPTEVVVFVDTTLGVPCEVDTLRINVQGSGDGVEREVPAADGQVSWTILKDSGGDEFTVNAYAVKAGRVVASGTAIVEFGEALSRQVDLVLGPSCMDAVCDFSDRIADLGNPSAAQRESCEGKASRYTYAATSLVTVLDACDLEAGPFQDFVDLSNDEVPVDDTELTGMMSSSFDFRLYGQKVERAWVSDDGYVSFGSAPVGATFDRVTNTEGLTSPGHPSFAVVPFWDNLAFLSGGRACVAMNSSSGRDTLWITWKDACLGPACAATDQIEFSVGLEEVSNRIIVGFESMSSTTEPDRALGAQAVVGIIREDDPACAASECNAMGLCSDGVTPCGFTQIFARQAQQQNWPATYVFDPVAEN
jgi:hypothetical protein